MLITGWQLVAARSMLGWGDIELAKKSNVSIETIRRIESSAGEAIKCNKGPLLEIISALKANGVVFIEGGVQVAQVVALEASTPGAKDRRQD